MKLNYYIFLSLLSTASACNTKQQNTTRPPHSTTATATALPDAPLPLTERLAQLGLTPDSHWRGLNLGDNFGKVKSGEKGDPFEQDARHVGYAIDLPNLASMDVLYAQQNEKISAISADLYLNSRSDVDTYQKDLSAHFTARYGSPKTISNGAVWSGPINEQIRLTDVSKGKDYGLKISITSVGRATASAW